MLFVPESRLNWFILQRGTTLIAVCCSLELRSILGYAVDCSVNEVSPLTGTKVTHATFTLKSVYMLCVFVRVCMCARESLGRKKRASRQLLSEMVSGSGEMAALISD